MRFLIKSHRSEPSSSFVKDQELVNEPEREMILWLVYFHAISTVQYDVPSDINARLNRDVLLMFPETIVILKIVQ